MQDDCHSIKNILEKEHIINDNNLEIMQDSKKYNDTLKLPKTNF